MCALPIPESAALCTHCASEQNSMTRWVKRYALAAAGVVAILPLFQAASSLSDLASGRNKADVILKAAACEKSGITIVAMNFGKGPAFLSISDFSVEGLQNSNFAAIKLRSEEPIKPVQAAGFVTILAQGWISSAQANLPSRGSSNACTYEIGVDVMDAYGETRRGMSCNCPSN